VGLCGSAFFSCGNQEREKDERLELADGMEWINKGEWSLQIAADVGEKLGGCAIGDVDPDVPGNEIVAVGESGAVYLVAFKNGAWTNEIIGQAPGEMVQCVLGDVDTNLPGLEIVVVGIAEGTEDDGGPGMAHVLFLEKGEWAMRDIYRSPALLHAACVAELDNTLGAEVLLAGFSGQVVVMDLTEDGWVEIPAGELPGAAKNAVAYQDGVALACADGSLVLVRSGPDGYATELIGQVPAGNARLATDGEGRLLVARDDGVLDLYTEGVRDEIYRESEKLRGAVLANIDPTQSGLEAVTGGYGKAITVLNQDGDNWDGTRIFEDTDKLHHLTAGYIGALGSSTFLVACGYSGRIIVLRRTPGN
jgi:hypothetical protein